MELIEMERVIMNKSWLVRCAAVLLAAMAALSYPATTARAVVGDINADGGMRASDARLVLRYSAKLEKLTTKQLHLADVNYDGRVNSADARILLKAAARAITLDNFYQYHMRAVFSNSATGASTALDTAWQDGKAMVKLDADSALIYDSASGDVTIIKYSAKQYSVMSFATFQKRYPKNAEYFADNGRSLRWSEHLPTPLYLEDQGFKSSASGKNTVYYKDFASGYQRYTFNAAMTPVKCEFYYNGSLMTLDISEFSNNPSSLFSAYLGFKRV